MAKKEDSSYLLWPYVIACRTNAKREDLVLAQWVNKFDVVIIFTDGTMYIYDTFLNMYRKIRYTTTQLTEEEWRFEFGRRLHDLLQRRYISEREFARMLKIQPPALNRYIQGKVTPSAYIMNMILTVLDIRADDLLFIPCILIKYLPMIEKIKEEKENV